MLHKHKGTIKRESEKELSSFEHGFPNNKAAFQLHLCLVWFFDLTFIDCHVIIQCEYFVYFPPSSVITERIQVCKIFKGCGACLLLDMYGQP